MYYLVYIIINLINEKIYIGVHKTSSLDDGYMGSGKLIKRAIEKYGIENFSKEILFKADSSEMMYEKEAELVDEDFVSRSDTYNIKEGGFGGFDHINKNMTEEERQRRVLSCKERFDKGREYLHEKMLSDSNFKESYAAKKSTSMKKYYESGGINGMKDKKHSEASKKLISDSTKGHTRQQGTKNSQYGKRWVYNPANNVVIKITVDALEHYISLGWKKGRKIKEKN